MQLINAIAIKINSVKLNKLKELEELSEVEVSLLSNSLLQLSLICYEVFISSQLPDYGNRKNSTVNCKKNRKKGIN